MIHRFSQSTIKIPKRSQRTTSLDPIVFYYLPSAKARAPKSLSSSKKDKRAQEFFAKRKLLQELCFCFRSSSSTLSSCCSALPSILILVLMFSVGVYCFVFPPGSCVVHFYHTLFVLFCFSILLLLHMHTLTHTYTNPRELLAWDACRFC